MIAIDKTPVENRGEALSEIWWRGKQWAVTEYGIECLNGRYHIRADDIAICSDPDGSWVAHMSEKNWVDLHDFSTALMIAVVLHGNKPQREAMLQAFKQYVRQPSLRQRPSVDEICAEIDSE